jgi:S1-C subfamily serine protease
MKASLVLSLVLGLPLATSASSFFEPTVIFGDDNRQEIYSVATEWQEISNSIAGKVSYEHITNQGGYWHLEGVPLNRRVCPSNRFSEQITVPSCSGFLVKPNILITAGHCMRNPEDCSAHYWVFGYALKSATDVDYQKVDSNQVYRCKSVLARRQEDFGAVDYTIIELDRPVVNRQPLPLGFHTAVRAGQSVIGIGHPNGLPMKLADGATIIEIADENRTLATDLDQFQGNSGSPIFDANTREVIGIASNGHADYVRDQEKLCKIPKICNPGDKCYLSASSRVTNLLVEPIFADQK